VANALMERRGTRVVLAGSRGEKGLCSRIAERAPGVVDLCGETDIAQFAALVGASSLVISNESSAISIASATGTPIVCLMTGVTALYGPYGVNHAVLQKKPDCYEPVGEHCFCPYGYRCLRDITPAEVLNEAMGLLGGGRSAKSSGR